MLAWELICKQELRVTKTQVHLCEKWGTFGLWDPIYLTLKNPLRERDFILTLETNN